MWPENSKSLCNEFIWGGAHLGKQGSIYAFIHFKLLKMCLSPPNQIVNTAFDVLFLFLDLCNTWMSSMGILQYTRWQLSTHSLLMFQKSRFDCPCGYIWPVGHTTGSINWVQSGVKNFGVTRCAKFPNMALHPKHVWYWYVILTSGDLYPLLDHSRRPRAHFSFTCIVRECRMHYQKGYHKHWHPR